MGYWSVFASVDYMDEHCDYEVRLPPAEALAELEAVLPSHGRVAVEQDGAGRLIARTLKNTPAWAWVVPFGWAWVRKSCRAEVTATPAARGSVIHVRGKLDTSAATRVRALRDA